MDELTIEQLKKRAVTAATRHDWEKAIEYNNLILAEMATDIPTLNRIAFSYINNGDIAQAKDAYAKVLEIDPQNPIATKNIIKVKNYKKSKPKKTATVKKRNTSFIEEPGKTKTVELHRPAKNEDLIHLFPGTQLELIYKKRKLSVEDEDHNYVGCLSDDLALRLSNLIKIGYTYEVYIKGIDQNKVTIFIRESFRSPSGRNVPSFPNTGVSSMADISEITKSTDIPVDVRATGEDF